MHKVLKKRKYPQNPGILFTLILMVLNSMTVQAQVDREKTIDGKVYQLQFSDEFNGTKLDVAKWTYRTDSKHWSTQLPANVELKNGFLQLDLKKEKSLDKNYTGAGIISADAFHFGYYETRMKIPEGAGWHTSFWLMRHDGTGGTGTSKTTIEIDICESDSKNPTEYGVNLHRWQNKHEHVGGVVHTPPLDEGCHIIACAYTPDYIKYYFDDKLVKTIDLKALGFPLGDLNIWLTSIASHLGGTKAVDGSKLPGTAQYDYVRFYALEK